MPARATRPLFSFTLALILLAMCALLLTAIAVDRATPEEKAAFLRLSSAP